MSSDVVLSGTISYPHVFQPRQVAGQGDPKFSCALILDQNNNWDLINAAIAGAVEAKFGANPPPNLKMPFTQAEEAGFEGQWRINAYSTQDQPPKIVDAQVQPVMDAGALFAGCKVNLYVRFYGYNAGGGRGVAVGLNGVQITDNVNVTRLDNRKDAADMFQPIPGAPVQTAPTPYSQQQPQAPAYTGPPGAVPPGAPQQPGPVQAPQPPQGAPTPGPAPAPQGPAQQPAPQQPGPPQQGQPPLPWMQ